MGSYQPISRIAIVGAGPVGTACAKYLLAEKAFSNIDIFEQRDRVGGVWNISPTDRTKKLPIPQEDPWYGSLHRPATRDGVKPDDNLSQTVNNDSLEFESPMYDLLETNIPKHVMQYSDTPFPDHYPLYPSHEETLEYLEGYADDVRHLIQFETQVQNVKTLDETSASGQPRWEVATRNLKTDSISKAVYDAIIIASGHYTVPHIVTVTGLPEWNKAYPNSIIHSKAYRRPEVYKDQRVLVIGNSASGNDIAYQIGPLSSKLYLSSKSETPFSFGKGTWKEDIDEVIEFLPPSTHTRAIRTRSGKVITDLDSVIFATGYFYSYPFLSSLSPPIITDGLRTRDTYQHFLHIEHPTLAFPVLNHKIIPFGLAENQAAVIARLWSGRLPIPSIPKMRAWESEIFNTNGQGKHFHLQRFPLDAAQMNDLYRWAVAATPVDGLENSGKGKLGMYWDRRRVWERSELMNMRMAFARRGEGRREVRDIKELGFDFEKWLEGAKEEDMSMFETARCFPE